MIEFLLNNQTMRTHAPAGSTLLDFIRYHQHLTGTKCGCREGDCGACTVLVGALAGEQVSYRAMTSCLLPLANVQGKHVVTIEGVNPPDSALTPVQAALVAENGTQCGFCTVGFVMSMTAYCLDDRQPGEASARAAIDGNICRCTGYKSIERAAQRLNALLGTRAGQQALPFAVQQGVVPAYFKAVAARLGALQPSVLPQSASDGLWVGGGTDLYVQRAEAMEDTPARYVRVGDTPIRETENTIVIDAGATVTDWQESPVLNALFPRLQQHLKLVSSTPIRNMATVGGNLANASPIGDLSIWLLALDAQLCLRGETDARWLPLRDFYLGYKTLNKTPEERIEAIQFARPTGDFYFNFEKVCKRTHLDIASVNTALSFQVSEERIVAAHLAAGGVAPIPLYLGRTTAFLQGKNLGAWPDWLPEAQDLLLSEVAPISDVRGSADYKRLLLKQLFHAHLKEIHAL